MVKYKNFNDDKKIISPTKPHNKTFLVGLIVLLSFFMLIPMISAGLTDRVVYDEEKSDLAFEVKSWWGFFEWLGIDQTIVKGELTSHKSVDEIKQVGLGWQRVMEYELEAPKENLGNIIGDIKFINGKDGKEVDKDYYLVYKFQEERTREVCLEYEVIKNDTKEGDLKESLNQTEPNCLNLTNETYLFTEWREYNSKDLMKGNITLGLMVYNEQGDYIDGIWSFGGKRITKHAYWNASLDNGLVAYYKLDETSGAVIDSLGNHNGTNSGATQGADGKIEKAYNLTDDPDYVNLINTSSLNDAISISLWFYAQEEALMKTILARNPNVGMRALEIYQYGDGVPDQVLVLINGDADPLDTNQTLTINGWNHIVFSYDKTDGYFDLYVNGVLDQRRSKSASLNENGNYFRLGNYNLGTAKGVYDEIGMWSRALTSDEISLLYSDGDPPCFECYEPSSVVTLIEPVDYYNSSSTSIDFNCNASSETANLVSLELFINGSIYENVTSAGATFLEVDSTETLSDGYYNWYCNATTNASEVTQSDVRYLTVDTTPFIEFVSPTYENATNLSTDAIPVNISLTETYFQNLTIYFYKGGVLNESITFTNSTRFYNKTGCTCDNWEVNATTCTTTGQCNSTETRFYIIDILPPTIDVHSPTNTTYYTKDVLLNVTTTDAHSTTTLYSLNGGANETYSTTVNLSTIKGNNNLIVYANDSFGNIATPVEVDFIVQTINVTLNSPADSYLASSALNTFNASASSEEDLVNMSLWTDEGGWSAKEIKRFSNLIYDEINDSSINTNLWATRTTTDGGLCTSSVTEDGDRIDADVHAKSGGGTCTSTASIYSKELNYSNETYYDIVFRVGLSVSSSFHDTSYLVSSSLSIFGNTIEALSQSSGDSSQSTDSVWTIRANGSNFDVYDDGVYQETITPSNNNLTIIVSGRDSGNRDRYANGYLYYVYFESPTNFTQTFNDTIPAGSTIWNVEACNSDGDCNFATSNRTIILDSEPPVITAVSGNGTFDYAKAGTNKTLYVTATDEGTLDECWINYNSVNYSYSCSSGVNSTASFPLTSGVNDAVIWVRDSASNVVNESVEWNFKVFENEQIYDAEVYETQTNNFILNITYSPISPISAILNYNGTNYTSSNFGSGTNGYFISEDLDASVVNGTENLPFYWIIDYGTEEILLDTLNQTVNPLIIQQCNATIDVTTLNFTFFDEVEQSNLNASANATTIKVNFDYWIGDGTIKKNYAFQNLTSSLNNYQFCLNTNETNFIDMDMQYFADGYSERTYYFRNHSVDNETQDILLYVLPNDDTIKFEVEVRQDISSLPDAVVEVWKDFVGLGEYKKIMVGLTDDKGLFPANIELDQSYQFKVYKDNFFYGTFERDALCSATPCEIIINVESLNVTAFEDFYEYFAQNVEYDLTYNSTSKMVYLTFEDNLGTAQYWRLFVYQKDFVEGTTTTICDNTSYTVSGYLTCNYTGYIGSNIYAKVLISRSPEKLVEIINLIESVPSIIGATAILATIIILLVIIFSGTRNPVNALVLIPFGLVLLKLVGFLPLSWIWIGGFVAFIIWIITRLKT